MKMLHAQDRLAGTERDLEGSLWATPKAAQYMTIAKPNIQWKSRAIRGYQGKMTLT